MRLSVTMSLALLLGCSSALASSPRTDRIATYLGDVVIRTDGAQVMVLLDTGKAGAAPDGEVDHWFTLQTEEPPLIPVMVHLEQAQVVHTPRALRVSTADERYELLLDPPKAPAGALTTRVVGIGLAHNAGGKGPKIKDQLDGRGHVVPTCEWCLQNDTGAGGGTGGAACQSGGPGSVQCSASWDSSSCSITCATNYYACCNAVPDRAYCRCVRG
jgi:hypothetical protein